MLSLIKQYTLPIIGVQFVALLLLGYLLYGSYTQWEVETKVKRDTVETVERDTVWGGFDIGFNLDDLEPRVITETERDTVVKDSMVYITESPGLRSYTEDFTRTLSSGGSIQGTITSEVRGSLENQEISLSADLPTVTEYKTRTITKEVTKTQVGKWRVVGSGDVFFKDGVEILAPGIGLQRPTKFSVFYKYDVKNGYHGASVNFPLSLLF
jgi:hypothetical protein